MGLENFRKDVLDYRKVYNNRNLEKTNFGLLNNYVFFIDGGNENIKFYIENNIEEIGSLFSIINRNFVYLPNLDSVKKEDLEKLSYYNPTLQKCDYNHLDNFSLLDYFFYQGDIKCGLIETNSDAREIIFYEFPDVDEIKTSSMVSSLISEIIFREKTRIEEEKEEFFLNAPYNIEFENDEIEVEEEIANEIKEIISRLEIIKKKGLLVKALPILELMTERYSQNFYGEVSKVIVNEDFRIFLTDFQIEIKLSHLTKSLYFFFLLNEQGFTFEDLEKEKNLLFRIYSAVSNQSDLEKLSKNIDNLLSDKDAYYVHLSRIKSQFYKKMQKSIADRYIIIGDKGNPKKISVNRTNVNMEQIKNYFLK